MGKKTDTRSAKKSDVKNDIKSDVTRDVRTENFYLHFKVSHPNMEFELTTKDPKILDKIQPFFAAMPDIDLFDFTEVSLKLSEPFSKNKEVAKLLQELLTKNDDYVITSVDIPTFTDIDVERDVKSIRVNRVDVKKSINKLLSPCELKSIRHGIVHISGDISSDDKLLIVDNVHKNMPTAQLRAFQSPRLKTQSSVFVECIFFGEFDESEDL